jgi:hypothetical protein
VTPTQQTSTTETSPKDVVTTQTTTSKIPATTKVKFYKTILVNFNRIIILYINFYKA